MKIGEEKEIALINTVISGKFTDELNRKNDFNYQFTIEQIINPYYMGTASSWCEGEGTVCDTKTQACTVTNGSGHKNITKLCNATNECLPPEYASECIVDVCDLGYYKAGNACTNCECTIGNNVSIKDNPALLWDPTFDDEDQRWCENICQQFSCDNIPDRGVFILRDDDLDGIYEVERYYSGNNYYALSTAISDAITGDKIYVGGGEYTFAGGNFDTGEKGIDLIICKDASISPD